MVCNSETKHSCLGWLALGAQNTAPSPLKQTKPLPVPTSSRRCQFRGSVRLRFRLTEVIIIWVMVDSLDLVTLKARGSYHRATENKRQTECGALASPPKQESGLWFIQHKPSISNLFDYLSEAIFKARLKPLAGSRFAQGQGNS